MPICEECGKKFDRRDNLNRHTRRVHKLQPVNGKNKFVCYVCSQSFSKNHDFEKHIYSEHDFETVNERISFPAEPDFVEWKRTLEGPVKFVVRNSRIVDGRRLVQYRCNRDGPVRIRVPDEDRKRKLKSQGSWKINRHCPARISATFLNDGTVDVIYCSTHFGHDFKQTHVPTIPVKRNRKTINHNHKSQIEVPLSDVYVLEDVQGTLSGELALPGILSNIKEEEFLEVLDEDAMQDSNSNDGVEEHPIENVDEYPQSSSTHFTSKQRTNGQQDIAVPSPRLAVSRPNKRIQSLTDAVQEMRKVQEVLSENDEGFTNNEAFGTYVASCLNKLSGRESILAQGEIHQILQRYRLRSIQPPTSRSLSSTYLSYSTTSDADTRLRSIQNSNPTLDKSRQQVAASIIHKAYWVMSYYLPTYFYIIYFSVPICLKGEGEGGC